MQQGLKPRRLSEPAVTRKTGLTYKDAGVDIEAGNQLVEAIKPLVQQTHRDGVLSGLGGFGGLFGIDTTRYPQPVLVSGTDGVGTKLKLAKALDNHRTIGIDLVAMCVNDIIVQGAEPLFFLDYFATGNLDEKIAIDVIAGISEGCQQAGCALIGGETAEMPDMYAEGDYDLAGFTVGAVNKPDIIDGTSVTAGDVLIGLDSSGPHSNGYSLIRKAIEVAHLDLSQSLGTQTLGEALLAPTRIYVQPLLELIRTVPVHAMAHITGGGLTENIVRVIPETLGLDIDRSSWRLPSVFRILRDSVDIAEAEMLRTFNCGIGMVVIVHPDHADTAISSLSTQAIDARIIGRVRDQHGDQDRVRYHGN